MYDEISGKFMSADELERLEDVREQILEDERNSLLISLSELTNEQLDEFLLNEFNFDLRDFLTDYIYDDGVYEYFVLNENQHYKNAMTSVLWSDMFKVKQE